MHTKQGSDFMSAPELHHQDINTILTSIKSIEGILKQEGQGFVNQDINSAMKSTLRNLYQIRDTYINNLGKQKDFCLELKHSVVEDKSRLVTSKEIDAFDTYAEFLQEHMDKLLATTHTRIEL